MDRHQVLVLSDEGAAEELAHPTKLLLLLLLLFILLLLLFYYYYY